MTALWMTIAFVSGAVFGAAILIALFRWMMQGVGPRF